MQKIKQVIIPPKEEQKKEIVVYSCDFCDHEHSNSSRFCQCVVCHRLICRHWVKSCVKHDPYDSSDYPDQYCPICYELRFKKYEPLYQEIEKKHDQALEKLDEMVKMESLKTQTKKKETGDPKWEFQPEDPSR